MYKLKQNSIQDYILFFVFGAIFYVITIVLVFTGGMLKYALITGNISAWVLFYGGTRLEKTKELKI